MITKKLIQDIQSWANSLYNFKNKDDDRNKHIICSVENFAFNFVCVSIRIWSLRIDGSLHSICKGYNKNIKSNKDFIEFKNEVNSTIDNYIKVAINVTNERRK